MMISPSFTYHRVMLIFCFLLLLLCSLYMKPTQVCHLITQAGYFENN